MNVRSLKNDGEEKCAQKFMFDLDNLCARRGVHTLAWLLVSWVVSSYRWISTAIIGFCHLRSLSQSPHDDVDDRYDFALAREILANPLYRGERRKTIYFSLRNESTRSRSATLDGIFLLQEVGFFSQRTAGMECALPKTELTEELRRWSVYDVFWTRVRV